MPQTPLNIYKILSATIANTINAAIATTGSIMILLSKRVYHYLEYFKMLIRGVLLPGAPDPVTQLTKLIKLQVRNFR